MKLSEVIAKYEAMRKIMETKNNCEAVIILSEVIADLKYILSQRNNKNGRK